MSTSNEGASSAEESSPEESASEKKRSTADEMLEEIQRAQREMEGPPVPVEFPSSSPDDQTKITRSREFPAWSGRGERIARISEMAEQAMRRAFEDAKEEIEKQSNYMRELHINGYAITARVRGRAGSMERQGSVVNILSEMDSSEIEYVEISNSPHPSRFDSQAQIKVQLGTDSRYPYSSGNGVELEVTGSDSQWVLGTFESLLTEIRKDVPYWSVLRQSWGSLLFVCLVFVALITAYFAWASSEVKETVPAVMVGVIAAAVGLGLHAALVRWCFVPFEVLEPGQKSRARRVGGAIVGFVAFVSALVGIFVVWAD